jgi:hypothetical protein
MRIPYYGWGGAGVSALCALLFWGLPEWLRE